MMDIGNILDINVVEAVEASFDSITDKVTNTVEQAKGSLPQIPVHTVVTSSIADWTTQHPAFLKTIKLFNWSISHPIISLILILFSLAVSWSLIKVIGRFIESVSLSILKIPLKLLQILIKYSWRSLTELSKFVAQKNLDTNILNQTSEYKLPDSLYQMVSNNKQQRLTDISTRLAEIQREQQELLQEASDILDSEEINSSVN